MGAEDRDFEQILGADAETPRSSGYRAHALLVAGMHRTGTSAFTRVMSLRGLELPRNLIPGVPHDNDLGFWEPALVGKAQDRFFEAIGSSWDDVSPIPPSVFSSPIAEKFVDELEQLLRSEYGESTLFVVKDPRLCRLIPVWRAALERYGARPSFVITTRNPLEVAASLRARDGFSATKSCLLWLRYLLDAEHDSRGFPRVFVSYENLLRNWMATTDRIARELNIFWPRADHVANLQIENFLSSQLRHHSFDYSELQARGDVAEWVKQAYAAVSRATSDGDEIDTELFDDIRRQVDRADQAYGPLLAQLTLDRENSNAAANAYEQDRDRWQAAADEFEQNCDHWQERAENAEKERAGLTARIESTLTAAATAATEREQLEARLQAELEQLALERDHWRRSSDTYEQDRDRWQERAEDAAKERAGLAERIESALAVAAAAEREREQLEERLQAELEQLALERDHWRRSSDDYEQDRDRWQEQAGDVERDRARVAKRLDSALTAGATAEAQRKQLEALLQAEVEQRERLEARLQAPGGLRRRRLAFAQFVSWLIRGRVGYVQRFFALRRSFDADSYLASNDDVMAAGLHPLLHYIEHGAREGRGLEPPSPEHEAMSPWARRRQVFSGLVRWLARGRLRCVRQYFVLRRSFGYDPYLVANPDVADAGLHPLLHYIEHGAREGRALEPAPREAAPQLTPAEIAAFRKLSGFTADASQERSADPTQAPSPQLLAAADEVRRRVQPAPEFEEFDPQIAANATPRAKAIAFYLPQFHAIPENDEWWGKGFTEWTNVARGYPRFTDHYQPRVPRDLGFYDLEQDGILERQVELARASGIHGFSFHYYWFDGKRLLEKPLERFLSDPSIDFPFCLTWANENWTRRWDGLEDELLMEQTYDPDRDADLIDDLQRHFDDDRYIRIEGRPLLLIYRIDIIPDLRNTVDRWREIWRLRHDEDPLILAAQSFWNIEDPRLCGLDGAIEFPPHRVALDCGILNNELEILDPSFTAEVSSYAAAMEVSLSSPHPDFPLVKTIIPSWDNDARREGQGLLVHGSTPELYENWLRELADIATAHPLGGESLVFINAWNEWAEGAYLEPDVHYGAAYLNATARALCAPRSAKKPKNAGVAAEYTHAADPGIVTAELRAALEGEFDSDYYLTRYPDVRKAGVDPLEHYVRFGWREGRDPSSGFSTSYYLSANPDVAAAEINPFVHFVVTGRSEGRLARSAWGLRRETLENLRSVDEEITDWREYHGPAAAPMDEGSLTRLLADFVGTRRHVVISCSHDDYSRFAGGVQLCVKLEQEAFDDRDCAYLNLHPAEPLHVLSRETEPEALTLALVGDGEMLGAATAETILAALTHLGSEGIDFGLVVHHLRGHSPEVIAHLYDRLNPRWAWLWLHDFFVICPNPTLLRNTIEPCHAPPPESAGCMICVFGDERIRHVSRLRELLDRVPFELVAPSQFMADRWKEYFGNDQLAVTVHEHGAVTRDATTTAEPCLGRVPVDGPARVAFVGYPFFHKGWDVFLELVRRHARSGEYRFYHFGDGSSPEPDIEQRTTSFLEGGPHAMIDALRADSIELAVVWSIVEESFCFTAYEALAAGAALVTNEGSGNVARVVETTGNGLVFGDEQELFDAFAAGSILDFVHSRRLTQQSDLGHFVHGNLTADLAHFDD